MLLGVYVCGLEISHVLYADDAVLLAEWDPENANMIVRIIRCLYIDSGLRINFHKQIDWRGIPFSLIEVVADRVRCMSNSLPFVHLNVPVGQNMAQVSAWSSIIDRFRSRLSGWKEKGMSFGGSLTFLNFLGKYW